MKKVLKIILKIFLSIFMLLIIFILSIFIDYKIKEKQKGKIVEMLDNISQEENSVQKFKDILPELQRYSTVESAWMYGNDLHIKFKYGMQISWLDR